MAAIAWHAASMTRAFSDHFVIEQAQYQQPVSTDLRLA